MEFKIGQLVSFSTFNGNLRTFLRHGGSFGIEVKFDAVSVSGIIVSVINLCAILGWIIC
jgi:hypothetical protein